MTELVFVDWDHRPAVLVGDKAFAVLRPGAAWVPVDRDDVFHTAAGLSEAAWRKTFMGKFGRLDVLQWRPGQDNEPQTKPLPRSKDFDDAARAVYAAYLEDKVPEAIKLRYSSVGALVMARAQKRLAKETDDADLMAHAIELERRALEAIKLGLSKLPEPPEVQNPAS